MSDYTRQQTGPTTDSTHPYREGQPTPKPAEQPKEPNGECKEIPVDKPPELEEPKCPDPQCSCPPPPTSSSNCISDLIRAQEKEIAEAETAKAFKEDLEKRLQDATAAQQSYTNEKYEWLIGEWNKLDLMICEAIRALDCELKCWWCLIECYVCPLLNDVRNREKRLYGDWALYADVHSLYDLRYWHERNLAARSTKLERIKNILEAWKDPAKTIDQALKDNRALFDDKGKLIASDVGTKVFDLFLKIVPLHLAIAPPAASGEVTCIRKEYTEFCACDDGDPDDCCGPDVGAMSVRQRVVGPKPYLVRPDQYFDIICCLIKKRYLPAKDAYARAKADFDQIDAEVTRIKDEIDKKIETLEKDAIAVLPKTVDCEKDYKPQPTKSESSAQAAR